MDIPKIVKTYVDAAERIDLERWIDTFAPDGTYSDPLSPEPISPQQLKEHFAGLLAGFPSDLRFDSVDLYGINEDLSAWRWVMRGTNTGPYRGLPPTGRRVALPGCEFTEVRDGKVRRVEGYFDRLTMLGQLGLAPSLRPVAQQPG